MGAGAAHSLGGVGVQYVIWTAADQEDLDRCEGVLKELSAHRDTRSSGPVKAVEGRDPDDIVVLITYPGPDQVPLHELPVRIYGWWTQARTLDACWDYLMAFAAACLTWTAC